MKLTNKINNLLEAKINVKAIVDQLVNNEEVTEDDLVDIGGLDKKTSKVVIDAWFKLSVRDRDQMSFNNNTMEKWVKSLIK